MDTWILIVKPVYKLLNVSDDQKWTTNTHVTPFTLTFKVLEDLFLAPSVFYPSTHMFTRLNDGWMGLYIKLC